MWKGPSLNQILKASFQPRLVKYLEFLVIFGPKYFMCLWALNDQCFCFIFSECILPILVRNNAISDLKSSGKNLKKTNNWKRSLAVCTPTKIFLYDSEADKTNKAFSLAIDINKVDSVRPMEHGELWRISAKNVPRLFRISFFSDDRTAADLDVSVVSKS